MERFVADTHSLVWYFTKAISLSETARSCFKRSENNEAIIFVPTIVLAEALFISEKKRIAFDYEDFTINILASTNYSVYPFDFEILSKLKTLRAIPELHDRIITATALLTSSTLITKDQAITSSGLVKTIW